ncbi:MAG: single-stranded DNA-binding protein [Bacteroidaceae bacterium]|nr:single-stranded DNA-binding protein [Bacteroidaceae bacterium]
MNKVILMGRLTKEPELRATPQGVSVCSFSIAVNRRFAKEGQQNADFINCTAWRTTADFISKYFTKGNMISVVGSIQSRSWEDSNGKKQYATDVVIDEAYFTGSKESTSPSPTAMPSEFEGFAVADAVDNTDLPWG